MSGGSRRATGAADLGPYARVMDELSAANRWATTWERCWTAGDAGPIVALYAPGAPYRSHPHRDPESGGAAAYVTRTFAEETDVVCRFGDPITAGGRACVEWWSSWEEDGATMTLSGATVLRFDADGLVIEHVDYRAQSPGRLSPFAAWGNRG